LRQLVGDACGGEEMEKEKVRGEGEEGKVKKER
jgi:hypothetical protein